MFECEVRQGDFTADNSKSAFLHGAAADLSIPVEWQILVKLFVAVVAQPQTAFSSSTQL